jgi:2-polyprenyl-3-methyl-5-hydroxy-6-metoxy-1,4-benzoquinol methylase
MSKIKYLLRCIRHLPDPRRHYCPSCGAKKNILIARKNIVTALRRCSACSLQFRTPTTSPAENEAYYQAEYSQGSTTDVPDEDELEQLKHSKFIGTERDFTNYLTVLDDLGVHSRAVLFDFGASWGYGSWQLQQAGYFVTGYEISRARANYATRALGVPMVSDPEDIPAQSLDVFFSAHVLEHVPSIRDVTNLAGRKLKPGGLFIAFTPNGDAQYRQAAPDRWRKLWGEVHPNFLDSEFYRRIAPSAILASPPYNHFRDPRLTGPELVAAWRMKT